MTQPPTRPIRDNATNPAAEHARDVRMHRWIPIGMALCLAGVAGVVVVLFLLSAHDSGQISGLQDQVNTYVSDIRALGSQVRGLGATPVVQPPPAAVPGAQGPAGQNGVNGIGIPGPPGSPGLPGPTGQPGATGVPGGAGAPGAAGSPGQDGQTGAPGPAGPAGPQGQPGPAGSPPAGWSWRDTSGTTFQCARDSGSPNNSPTYTCTSQAPTTTTAPPLLPIPT